MLKKLLGTVADPPAEAEAKAETGAETGAETSMLHNLPKLG